MNKLLLIFIFYLFVIVTPVFGQEATTSGEVKGTKTASESSTLSEKLNTLLSESASKAAAMVKDINKKLQNKAIYGKITDISKDRVILQTKKGTKNVTISEFTAYQDRYKTSTAKKLSFKNLEKDDIVVALGDVDDKGNLIAKKIIFLDNKLWLSLQSHKVTWGQVQSINGSTISLKNNIAGKNQIFTNGNTSYQLGNEESTIAEVKLNKFIVSVGEVNTSEREVSNFIYILTKGGTIKPEKNNATSSALPNP